MIRGRDYFKKRLLRLLLPAWLLFSMYYLMLYVFVIRTPDVDWFRNVLATLILSQRVTSVWIIRVFLLLAMVAPFLLRLKVFCQSKIRFSACLCFIYLGYRILLHVFPQVSGGSFLPSYLWEECLLYLLPYGCVFGVGMMLPELKVYVMRFVSTSVKAKVVALAVVRLVRLAI